MVALLCAKRALELGELGELGELEACGLARQKELKGEDWFCSFDSSARNGGCSACFN